jgi:hypothetical protein
MSLLTVTVNGIHLHGSPFLITVVNSTDETDVSKSLVLRPQSTAVSGSSINIFIQARDKFGMDCTHGEETFNVKITNTDSSDVTFQSINVEYMDNGLYSARFTSFLAGAYIFQVYFNQQPISGGERGSILYGTDSSVILGPEASSINDFYTGNMIWIDLKGSGQLMMIDGYSGLSKRCALRGKLSLFANSSYTYEIFSFDHVITVVPSEVSLKSTVECYSSENQLIFYDSFGCGIDNTGNTSSSFLFLIIFRDEYSNKLTVGIETSRVSLKVVNRGASNLISANQFAFSENWCSDSIGC